MPAVLTFVGLEALKAEIRRLPQALAEEAGAIVLGAANRAESAIVARYPQGPTGNLKDGVSIHEAIANRFGVRMVVRSAAAHAHLYEYGSASRDYHGANRGRMPAAAGGPVFVPEMQRARAWMYDALRRLIEAHELEVVGQMDTSAIGNALVARLGSDAALLALMPNGAYFDTAGRGATRYVLVKLQAAEDVAAFGGRAYESAVYLVKAVGLERPGTPLPDVAAAAARIEVLLEDQPLTVAGYAWMTTHREEFVRYPEPEGDGALTWNHRGGLYRVEMSAADVVEKQPTPRVTTGNEGVEHGDQIRALRAGSL